MKTENLIQELTQELKPVKRLESPLKRLVRFAGVAVFCFLGALSILGVREDLNEVFSNPAFLLQAIILFALTILSGLSALILSVPGEERSPIVRWIPILVFVLWAGTLGSLLFLVEDAGPVGRGLNCIRDILVFGALPGAVLFIMVRKATTFKFGWSGFLLLLSVASLGALGTQFVCRNDSPLHLLVWHFLPVALAGLIGIGIGRLLLNRQQCSRKY